MGMVPINERPQLFVILAEHKAGAISGINLNPGY